MTNLVMVKSILTPFEETIIGNNVLIGSNSTILPVTIVDDVIIGAGSVVTKDIIEPGIYFGNPAHKKSDFLKIT